VEPEGARHDDPVPAVRPGSGDHRGPRPAFGHRTVLWRGPLAESATDTVTRAAVTWRERRTARVMSCASGGRPDPRWARSSSRPPYAVGPPSRSPRAPANAASATPALGDGWAGASSRTARHTSAADTGRTAATSSAVKRA